jgi:hypothetical protein
MTPNKFSWCVALVAACVGLAGCKTALEQWLPASAMVDPARMQPARVGTVDQDDTKATTQETPPAIATVPIAEPDFITVQHILIGFKGSVPGKQITRTKEEAEKLANEVLELANVEDADFDALVKKYTDDAHPGIYKMANSKVPADSIPRGVYPRGKMVRAFGDIGFPLQAGEVGLAKYDAKTSPFGWHIIKRTE